MSEEISHRKGWVEEEFDILLKIDGLLKYKAEWVVFLWEN